jgi:hypothetical protein
MKFIKITAAVILFIFLMDADMIDAKDQGQSKLDNSIKKMNAELISKYGESQKVRIERGLNQTAALWRDEDGDAAVFEDFVRTNFAGTQAVIDAMFNRYEYLLEQLNGHMISLGRLFREQTDLDLGEVYPFDEIFSSYDAGAHVSDDFFKNKLAFVALLNFPLTTLEQRLSEGEKWTRREWAETRLAQKFSSRVPAEVNLAFAKASADAELYIANYNIWMHHLVNEKGERLFPEKMRLLSHWNLRDELKSDYDEGAKGFEKQKTIQKVMERIVDQTIPEIVINNPLVDWNPFTNAVKITDVKDSDQPLLKSAEIKTNSEPDTRYLILLNDFLAVKKADPYSPVNKTHIERKFNEERELPEARVKKMFEDILSSPVVEKTAKLIEKRLGRKLEPFDIWYNGFRAKSKYSAEQLDEIVRKKYPTAEAYKTDIPNMLVKFGFTELRAKEIADNIIVDPARGSGHAMGAGMRSDKAHLRTRVGKNGMDYKGFNIAVHEMGHNVEQTISLNNIDHTLLEGVPNTAFTEALAFVFQNNDLMLLGLSAEDQKSEASKTMNDFWAVFEIAGVSLVDMELWHWMYDNPNADPAQLKQAVLKISKDIWNKYYAPVFNQKDVTILAIYSHIIHSFLYLPDYPIGHMIAFQIEEQMKKAGSIGSEFERVARIGSIAPDLWMKTASGHNVGPEAMIEAAEKALKELE